MHLKNTFSSNHQFCCWSLKSPQVHKVPWKSRTLGPLGDLQGTSSGRRVPAGKNIIFDDEKIKKSNFYKDKKLPEIDEIDANKMLISKKETYGKKISFKYFIGYNYDDVIRSLCIKLPQMIGYVKCFDSNKTMSFKVTDKNLLK